MCLTLYRKKDRFWKIAWKPIIVYKYLHKDLKSPFYGFQWKLNKVYFSKLSKHEHWGTSIITNAFHSCKYESSTIYLVTADKFKAVIPRFSIYYYDSVTNQYASNCLKIIEKCV